MVGATCVLQPKNVALVPAVHMGREALYCGCIA